MFSDSLDQAVESLLTETGPNGNSKLRGCVSEIRSLTSQTTTALDKLRDQARGSGGGKRLKATLHLAELDLARFKRRITTIQDVIGRRHARSDTKPKRRN